MKIIITAKCPSCGTEDVSFKTFKKEYEEGMYHDYEIRCNNKECKNFNRKFDFEDTLDNVTTE